MSNRERNNNNKKPLRGTAKIKEALRKQQEKEKLAKKVYTVQPTVDEEEYSDSVVSNEYEDEVSGDEYEDERQSRIASEVSGDEYEDEVEEEQEVKQLPSKKPKPSRAKAKPKPSKSVKQKRKRNNSPVYQPTLPDEYFKKIESLMSSKFDGMMNKLEKSVEIKNLNKQTEDARNRFYMST